MKEKIVFQYRNILLMISNEFHRTKNSKTQVKPLPFRQIIKPEYFIILEFKKVKGKT